PDVVELQADAGEAEPAPQPSAHDDVLGVHVGPGVAESLDAVLVELAVAAFLGPLVAIHRPRVPQALRTVVQQAVLDRRAHAGGGAFRAQGELLLVTLVATRRPT